MNEHFTNIWLSHFRDKSREDVINLYLEAIIESYKFIDKSVADENIIRDRIYWDLTERNPILKDYLESKTIKIGFEEWKMVSKVKM